MEEFIPPPEAPVFQPTIEEFKDPIAYISKIRPVVVNTGICKIRPPLGWKPPFAVNIETFTFTPRIQPLNELEAKTRVKLNFLENLAKFWELQGIVFKIPNVDRHPLDLHGLFKVVTGMGGYQEVCKLRKWASVAKELSYCYVTVSGSLKANYERYLHPYEVFLVKNNKLQEVVGSADQSPSPVKSTSAPQRTGASKYSLRQQKRRTRSCGEDSTNSVELDMTNPEFKKLAFTAPGPKNSFAPVKQEDYRRKKESQCTLTVESGPVTCDTHCYSSAHSHPPLDQYLAAHTDSHSIGTKGSPNQSQTVAVIGISNSVTGVGNTGMGVNGSGMEFGDTEMQAGGIGTGGNGSQMNAIGVKSNGGFESMVQESDQAVPTLTPVKIEPELIRSKELVFQCGTEREDLIEEVKCVVCGSGDCDEELLLCDGCDDSYHMFCLEPPLASLPPGEWRCPTCVAEECNKPQDAFGFEQAEKQYTLRTFGEMANSFKQDYFGRPPHEVPYAAVEREFWRLVSSIEDEVIVEYGADLHTSKVGSGFPWESSVRGPEQEKYAKSLWNLNKIPNADGCVLKYIDADISGMKVPWAYVGMCFSCFCWHIEDHWSYSINYLHWGEPKTWYGVPSAYAESLEATMKDQAPELFENHADLMHDLVTTLSPSILMKNGIPVVRTDQCAGEFVVTFPRAYHAGFNQGFNFAEAVNFSLDDWISMGRASIDHYQSFNRAPVFSHDELICKMMVTATELDLCLLSSTFRDAEFMVAKEEYFRDGLAKQGYVSEQRELFEIVRDEERQCSVCNTYCFLSAVKCFCQQGKLACPQHVDNLCECPPSKKVLKYRYTMSELRGMLASLSAQATAYCSWVDRVEAILDAPDNSNIEFQTLKDLYDEATDRDFTSSEICEELFATLQEVQKCIDTANQIVNGQAQRVKGSGVKVVDVGGLKSFLLEVQGLPCKLPEAEALRTKLSEIESYQQEAQSALAGVGVFKDGPTYIEQLIKKGESFDIFVPEVKALRVALQQSTWMTETLSRLDGPKLTIDTLKTMAKLGANLSHGNPSVEATLNRVKNLLSTALSWDQKARDALKHKPPHTVEQLTALLEEAKSIPVILQLKHTINEALGKAKSWSAKARTLLESDGHPHYNSVKALLESGRSIPVKLHPMPQLESCYTAAKAWFDRASRAFMKKGCSQSLLEVLLPRNKASFFLRHVHVNKGLRKRESDSSPYEDPLAHIAGDQEKVIAKIHEIEELEKTFAIQLRTENTQKMEQDEAIKGGKSNTSPVLYCFCQKPESGYMLQCELCHEWYHGTCLRLPKGKQGTEKELGKWSRFLCTYCQRTKRPRLDTIVSLLISLQKVPVSFTEGSALQSLTERAIAWQKRARQSISNITLVLESAKTQQKRIQEIKGHILRWRNEAKAEQSGTIGNMLQAQLASSAGSVLQHYETELERLTAKYAGLSSSKRMTLDNLLMEGDLLEVTLDEVQQLWQMLQQDAHMLAAFQKKGNMDIELPTEDQDKRRRRKRKEPSPALSTTSTTSSDTKPPLAKKSKRKPKTTPKAKLQQATTSDRKARAHSTGSASSNDGLECSEEIAGDGDEEEEGVCSAIKCRQPMAEEISWVQCDTCQGWFHCLCVGLTKEMAERIDSYCCVSCKSGSAQKASQAATSSLAKRRGMLELQRALQNSLSSTNTKT